MCGVLVCRVKGEGASRGSQGHPADPARPAHQVQQLQQVVGPHVYPSQVQYVEGGDASYAASAM